MKQVLQEIPEEPLIEPVDMVTVRIDPDTGLLARPESQDAIYETFRKQYVPTEMEDPTINGQIEQSDGIPLIDLF